MKLYRGCEGHKRPLRAIRSIYLLVRIEYSENTKYLCMQKLSIYISTQ